MGRRMTEMARHWVRAVLPRVRTRQWVLSLPFELRVPLAYRHELTLAVHGVAAPGSITAVQRFGSDLALNVPGAQPRGQLSHMLFIDGVYAVLGHFTPITAPTRAELEATSSRALSQASRSTHRQPPEARLTLESESGFETIDRVASDDDDARIAVGTTRSCWLRSSGARDPRAAHDAPRPSGARGGRAAEELGENPVGTRRAPYATTAYVGDSPETITPKRAQEFLAEVRERGPSTGGYEARGRSGGAEEGCPKKATAKKPPAKQASAVKAAPSDTLLAKANKATEPSGASPGA